MKTVVIHEKYGGENLEDLLVPLLARWFAEDLKNEKEEASVETKAVVQVAD